MKAEFIERIHNNPAPSHDIYQDMDGGLYGECLYGEGHVPMWLDGSPRYAALEQCREDIARYDGWLEEYSRSSHDTETYIGMADAKSRTYWRRRRILETTGERL